MKDKYYLTKESVEEYTNLTNGHDGSLLIEKLKTFLPRNSSLLEIGTGPGNDWKILDKYYNVVGSDFSPEFLKQLHANIPDGTFQELNAISLTTKMEFEGIYSNKVLHHLSDSELHMSIKRQHETLTKDGVICHSFWKGEGTENYNGMFVNNHQNKELEEVFDELFDILLLENYMEFENNDSILLIGRKK